MSPGTYISLTLHASLVGWLLFNGDFEPTPLELPVTEVSVVSLEMFDIMVNNTAPIIEMELEAASRQPSIEDTQAPADSITDKAPQQVTQMLSQIAQNDALPETVPNQPERMEEVVIIPPLELTAPEIEAEAPEPLATSLPPKPRPAPRIAPVEVAPPAPDVDIGEITRDAAAPQLEPAQVVKEQTAKSPEAAAPEIVTEAEKPSEAVELSKLAPPRTVRPQRRPASRPVVELPIDPPEPTVVTIDPLAAALAEALSGTTSEPDTQGTATEALAPHLVTLYGAPDLEAARPVATEELSQMAGLCADHTANTLLTVSRELTPNGVGEAFRTIEAQAAGIEQFAIHGSLDEGQ